MYKNKSSFFSIGEVGYYLGHHFKAPTATFITLGSKLPTNCYAIGQPFNPSYMKIPIIPIEGKMNILDRAKNTFVTMVFTLFK